MTAFLTWPALFLATSMVAVPTPPGSPSTDIAAHHGVIYQTSRAGAPTQGFADIINSGPADQLTAATCPLADATTIVDANNKSLETLTIPANQTLSLTANGPHLLLQNTHFSVDFGAIVPCSLTFTTAGTISVFLYAKPGP
jgi:copper(I)-binding protein